MIQIFQGAKTRVPAFGRGTSLNQINMKKIITIVALLTFTGCQNPAESIQIVQEPESTICDTEQVIKADASTKATYTNQEYSFEIQLPYNPNWGTQTHKVPVAEPIEVQAHKTALSRIIWGPLISDTHFGCTRPFEILVTEPRSVDQALTAYRETDLIDNMGFLVEPQSYSLNNIPIAEFIVKGPFCQQGAVEVFTPKYNLYFTTGCEWEELHNQFKEAVETLNFL